MAPWTLTSPGKPTKMASEIPKVGVSCRPEAQRGGGGYRSAGPLHGLASPMAGEFWLGLEKVCPHPRGLLAAAWLCSCRTGRAMPRSLQFPIHLGVKTPPTACSSRHWWPTNWAPPPSAQWPLPPPFSTWDQDRASVRQAAPGASPGEQSPVPPILPFSTELFCIPAPPSTPSVSMPLFFAAAPGLS